MKTEIIPEVVGALGIKKGSENLVREIPGNVNLWEIRLRGFLSRMKNWSPDTLSSLEGNSLHQGSRLHAITNFLYYVVNKSSRGGVPSKRGRARMVVGNFELNP